MQCTILLSMNSFRLAESVCQPRCDCYQSLLIHGSDFFNRLCLVLSIFQACMLRFERARAPRPFNLGKGHPMRKLSTSSGACQGHQGNDQGAWRQLLLLPSGVIFFFFSSWYRVDLSPRPTGWILNCSSDRYQCLSGSAPRLKICWWRLEQLTFRHQTWRWKMTMKNYDMLGFATSTQYQFLHSFFLLQLFFSLPVW